MSLTRRLLSSLRGEDAAASGKSLTVHHVRKSFGDVEVLRGIDLHVPAASSSSHSSAVAAAGKARFCAWWPDWTRRRTATSVSRR